MTAIYYHLCIIIIIMIVRQAGLLLLEHFHRRLAVHLDSFLTSFEPIKQSKADAQINSSPLERHSIYAPGINNKVVVHDKFSISHFIHCRKVQCLKFINFMASHTCVSMYYVKVNEICH